MTSNAPHDRPPRDPGSGGRRALLALKALGGLLALAALVGGLVQVRIDTSLESFLPADEPSVDALDDKAEEFGGDAVVVILESPLPRQLLLEREPFRKLFGLEGDLADLSSVRSVYGPATVLNQLAITAQGMLAQISGSRDGIRFQAEARAKKAGATKTESKAAGDAAVETFEMRYGSLLVDGMEAGLPTLKNTGFIRSVLFDQSGSPRPRWNFVVPDESSVALMIRPEAGLDQGEAQELTSDVRKAVNKAGLPTDKVTVTGVPVVMADLSDQMTTEFPLLAGLALVLLLLRFVLVPGAGSRRRRLLPLAAATLGSLMTLSVFGWLDHSLSLGAVALLPLLLGIGSSFPLYLSTVHNRRRVLVAAVASALAFASLALSPLPFVQQLGWTLAMGVLFTLAVAFVIVPVEARPLEMDEPKVRPGRRPIGVVMLVALAISAGAGWWALGDMEVTADPRDLAQGLPALEDATYAEQVLGSSGEVNVLLSGQDVAKPATLGWARQVEQEIILQHGDRIQPILTAPGVLEFLGKGPTPQQVEAGLDLIPTYISDAVITPDRSRLLMTFGLKLQSLTEQAQLLESVEQMTADAPPGTDAEVVGLPVAAADSYQLISNDRYLPNLAGIAAAALVLTLGLRRRCDGLRAMAAALLATGWTIGLVALLGVSLTPLSVAVGSLTTVTASEFYVLMADAHRRRSRAMTRIVAWAAITSGLGYLVLVVSSVSLLREFGLVLTASVLLSFVAAWLLVRILPGHSDRSRSQPPAQEGVSS